MMAKSSELEQVEVSKERVRRFPGWWIYQGATETERPFYRVVVRDEAELLTAKIVKPRSCGPRLCSNRRIVYVARRLIQGSTRVRGR